MGNRFLKRGFLASLLVSMFLHSAQASLFDLSELQKVLRRASLIRGDFTQTKTLQMLNAPLKSKGHFLLQKDTGLLWDQTQPFPVVLVLSDKTLYQKMPGQSEQVIHAKDNPLPFYFSRLFLDLFNGNTQTLSGQFSLSLKGDVKKWTLTLVPKKPPLSTVFKEISLSGGQYVQALTLQEIRGDKTVIAFTNVRDKPLTLTDGERRAFIH